METEVDAAAAEEEDPYAQFVVGGVYYPKNYTVDANNAPFDPNELAYRLHESSLQAMKMKDLYVSSDDQNPHGIAGVSEQGFETLGEPPAPTGRAVSVYKNDKTGDYEVMFVTKGTPAGIKLARDIFTRKKQKMSLSHTTEIEEDPETGKIKSIEFTGSHIAVLDEDVHEPGREGCDIRYIVPLFPKKNPHISEFRAALLSQRLAALNKDLSVVQENINRKNASQDQGAGASSSSGFRGQDDTIMTDAAAAPSQTPAEQAPAAAAAPPAAAPVTLESLQATMAQLRESGFVPESDAAANKMLNDAPTPEARMAIMSGFMNVQKTMNTINQMEAQQKAQAEREKYIAEAQQYKTMFENAAKAQSGETRSALNDFNAIAQEQDFGVSLSEEEVEQIMAALPQNGAGNKFRRTLQTACSRMRSTASREQGASFVSGQAPTTNYVPTGTFASSVSAPSRTGGISKPAHTHAARQTVAASGVDSWMTLSNVFDQNAHTRAMQTRDRVAGLMGPVAPQ